MVPGVMGVLLLVTTMVVTSMALVREREEGTIEQVIVTPIRVSELIAGKLLPFVAIGFVEITLALVIIVAVFRVPLEGSVGLLYLLSGLFLLSTLGLGLFISALVLPGWGGGIFALAVASFRKGSPCSCRSSSSPSCSSGESEPSRGLSSARRS